VAHISITHRKWVPQVWILRPGIPRTSDRAELGIESSVSQK